MVPMRLRESNRKLARRRAGLRRWHRWKANDRAGIGCCRSVYYDGASLARLIVSGWLPHSEVYTDEQIGRAISDLIRQGNLPRR